MQPTAGLVTVYGVHFFIKMQLMPQDVGIGTVSDAISKLTELEALHGFMKQLVSDDDASALRAVLCWRTIKMVLVQ